VTVRKFFHDLLGTGSRQELGDDLLALGTAAVMSRAMPLGDTLVLPSHVVFTLPEEELRLFTAPRLRDGLTRSLQKAVQQRSQEHLTRLRRAHGSQVVALGGDDLRISLVEGELRDAEARFDAHAHDAQRRPGDGGREPGGVPGPDAVRPRDVRGRDDLTVLDRPVDPDAAGPLTGPPTQADGGLRLVLRSDGAVVATVRPTPGRIRVGRDPASCLVVPPAKEKVSRQAVQVTRSAVAAVEVEVLGRNGVWVPRPPHTGAGPGRRHVGAGERMTLHVGERIDLDRAATVTLALEGSGW